MNFTMTRGDNVTFSGAATLDDDPYDLSGCSLIFTGKYRYTDADASAVFQKSIGSGITVTSAPQGLFAIALLPADTEPVPKAKTMLVWDLQLVDGSSQKFTIASGNLVVNPDVTNA